MQLISTFDVFALTSKKTQKTKNDAENA